ncbi:MAG: DUF2092 domain-containing protein [Hyphomicrobium sp.]|uniref:DUF2092 domain-containing protein n=1 Tax=Hyphomicrobium sp. TaxID=82 RepID=UPI0039E53DDB
MLRRLFFGLVAALLAPAGLAHAQTSAAAGTAFKQLDSYLQSNPLDFETNFDASSDGNELYRGKGHFILRQPDALRADTTLAQNTYLLISDGTVLTIYNPQQKRYSESPAPQSLSAAFGFFTGELGIDSQVLNFMGIVHMVNTGGGDGMKVTDAGTENIGGKSCDKFLINDPTDQGTWQVWLEKGDKPLMCKLIYRSVDGTEQSNVFQWNAVPTLTPQTFTFSPPAGSTKVDIGDLNMASP